MMKWFSPLQIAAKTGVLSLMAATGLVVPLSAQAALVVDDRDRHQVVAAGALRHLLLVGVGRDRDQLGRHHRVDRLVGLAQHQVAQPDHPDEAVVLIDHIKVLHVLRELVRGLDQPGRLGDRHVLVDREEARRHDAARRLLGVRHQLLDGMRVGGVKARQDLAQLGKDPGSDKEAGKTTYVDLLGVEGAMTQARQVMDEGIAALAPFGAHAEPLRALGNYTVDRKN